MRRIAGPDLTRRNILRNYGTGTDYRAIAYGTRLCYDGIHTYEHIVLDVYFPIFPFYAGAFSIEIMRQEDCACGDMDIISDVYQFRSDGIEADMTSDIMS